jgi:hypothetical protein
MSQEYIYTIIIGTVSYAIGYYLGRRRMAILIKKDIDEIKKELNL